MQVHSGSTRVHAGPFWVHSGPLRVIHLWVICHQRSPQKTYHVVHWRSWSNLCRWGRGREREEQGEGSSVRRTGVHPSTLPGLATLAVKGSRGGGGGVTVLLLRCTAVPILPCCPGPAWPIGKDASLPPFAIPWGAQSASACNWLICCTDALSLPRHPPGPQLQQRFCTSVLCGIHMQQQSP